jgi:hypothetical protein
MLAPERFAAWMNVHQYRDRRFGHMYRYHSRSDAHSIRLCELILEDLLDACPSLREQAARRQIVFGINERYTWASTGKSKTLDLAIGPPIASPAETGEAIARSRVADVLISCEAKSVMTEHGKSQPRVYDELNSSHDIVHQGRPNAIAAGITVVNIAHRFVSPLRQTGSAVLLYSEHDQPRAAARMIQHLRGLPIRERVEEVGFDAYATVVIDCDNVTEARLCSDLPAPQRGEHDHYEIFLKRVSRQFEERFASYSGGE